MDYVQLRFNGPCLTVYTLSHQIIKNGKSISWGEPGYRDALCDLIACVVKRTEIVDAERVSLAFENDAVWNMSLRDEDYRGLEAMMFNDDINKYWFVFVSYWR
jgi:hypothetical protein